MTGVKKKDSHLQQKKINAAERTMTRRILSHKIFIDVLLFAFRIFLILYNIPLFLFLFLSRLLFTLLSCGRLWSGRGGGMGGPPTLGDGWRRLGEEGREIVEKSVAISKQWQRTRPSF